MKLEEVNLTLNTWNSLVSASIQGNSNSSETPGSLDTCFEQGN